MSKKSKRNRAKYRASGKKPERKIVQSVPSESSKSISEPKMPVSSIPSKTTQATQTPAFQYKYVITELRNIGIITGAFAIILVILTFVLG